MASGNRNMHQSMRKLNMRMARVAAVVGAMLAVVVLTRVAARVSPDDPAVHEIRLVVRDMAYYVGDDPEINPTLRVRAGERVRVILTNDDAGMSHDFAIPDWEVAARLLAGKGSDTVEFTAPAAHSASTYRCTPHSATMRGTIVVE